MGYKDATNNMSTARFFLSIQHIFEATKTAGGVVLADIHSTVSLPRTSDSCCLRYVLHENKQLKQKQSFQEMLL